MFANAYAGLPERFFAPQAPAQVAAPRLIAFNRALAEELGAWMWAAIEAAGGGGFVRRQYRAGRARCRSPPPMPGTNSACSCRSLAMAAPSCSVRCATGMGRCATSS